MAFNFFHCILKSRFLIFKCQFMVTSVGLLHGGRTNCSLHDFAFFCKSLRHVASLVKVPLQQSFNFGVVWSTWHQFLMIKSLRSLLYKWSKRKAGVVLRRIFYFLDWFKSIDSFGVHWFLFFLFNHLRDQPRWWLVGVWNVLIWIIFVVKGRYHKSALLL